MREQADSTRALHIALSSKMHGAAMGADPFPRQHLSNAFDVSWNTSNNAVLDEANRVLINDDYRLDNASVIGIDEHVSWQTGRGAKYENVIIDLIPAGEKTGPARLVDTTQGRSKAVLTT